MKKILSLSLIIFSAMYSSNAMSFDLNDISSAVNKMDCNAQSIELVKEGGAEILNTYTQVKAGKSFLETALGDKKSLGIKLTKYVSDGCAEDLIKKAIAAGTLIE